jgi:hypothetical protein
MSARDVVRNLDSKTLRTCARAGCTQHVKKPTAKYCSVKCCSSDPVRHARLREQAQKSRRRIIPMNQQMALGFAANAGAEEQLAAARPMTEDVPFGMSRLASAWR